MMRFSMRDVERAVCAYFATSQMDLRGQCRARKYSHPRQVAMYLCREMTGKSYPQIASFFDGRDHTTAMHACRRISWKITNKPGIDSMVMKIRASVVPTGRVPTRRETASILQAHEDEMRHAMMGLA